MGSPPQFSTSLEPAISGEDIYWSQQDSDSDLQAAFNNHLQVNQPGPNDHLFSYEHKGHHQPLTKQVSIIIITTAARAAGLPPRKGHGICIGSTLEYLLQGVPFEAMKAKGRWGSDAFLGYPTHHTQVLALYIQAKPELHAAFLQITILSHCSQH
ncbi:hypothetical protein NP233_g452 [Leucocoprinus birnbaumii]|uniref:Uncharacterized protein n=1 Tax=Leucocoprinus birnbaumii TaxID=56174 RepID=A0AAD5W4A8_9AGAR|nr:hypothetical protein NP233_g452 [Leucocoprinus birnbaumii]